MSPAKGRTDTPPRIWKGFNTKFWTNLWSPSTARAPKYLFNSFSGFKFLRRWKEERKAPSVKQCYTQVSPSTLSTPKCLWKTPKLSHAPHGSDTVWRKETETASTGRESPAPWSGFLPALLQSWGILLLPSPGQLEPWLGCSWETQVNPMASSTHQGYWHLCRGSEAGRSL